MSHGKVATQEQVDSGAEVHKCPHPDCGKMVLDKTGSACCQTHQDWYNDEVAHWNAGVPVAAQNRVEPEPDVDALYYDPAKVGGE